MNHRILVVDDTEEIHDLFTFILQSMEKQVSPNKLESKIDDILAGTETSEQACEGLKFKIDHAFQGEQALNMIDKAHQSNEPYSLIYMDVRMPPGIDGIETIKRAREKYPEQEFVICTAFNNYEWEELFKLFGHNDKILYMSKPFCDTSLKQMTNYILTKVQKNLES